MATKLWTLHFMRICLANLLLFVSFYMLCPVIPSVMADRLGISVCPTGAVFLLFTLGMFCVGPFHGYLIDAYQRKQVCIFSFCAMLATTVGYAFVRDFTQLAMLCIAQGIAFGVVTTSGITLAIDITNTSFRSAGNVVFSWASRLGMVLGVASGVFLFQEYGLRALLYASVAAGVAGVYFISRVYVPFRAPIGVKLVSNDRFLLSRAWVPAVNLILIAIVPGMLLPVLFHSTNGMELGGVAVPFFALGAVGFLVSALLIKYLFHGEHKKMWLQIVIGLLSVIAAMSLLLTPGVERVVPSAVLLGMGLGLVTPEFLMMFVRLSQHCQRGTANTSHLLAWEVGVSAGIAVVCHLNASASEVVAYRVAMLSAVVALLFFVLVTYPYYRKKRIR